MRGITALSELSQGNARSRLCFLIENAQREQEERKQRIDKEEVNLIPEREETLLKSLRWGRADAKVSTWPQGP